MKEKSFLRGPAWAVGCLAVAQIVGACLRAPLFSVLGTEGMAYFQLAYPAYLLLFMACGLIFPMVLGQMVAAQMKRGDLEGGRTMFADGLLALVIPAAVVGILVALANGLVAGLCGMENAADAIRGVAPLFLLSMAAAALRGYFIGLGQQAVSALSLLVMEAGKLLFGLVLAKSHAAQGAQIAAQWAMLGICMGEILSLLMLAGCFFYSRARTSIRQGEETQPLPPMKETALKLWGRSGALLFALASVAFWTMLDGLCIPGRMSALGYTLPQVRSAYALYSGVADPMMYFPAMLCALMTALYLPRLREALENKNGAQVRSIVSFCTKNSLVLSIAAAVPVLVLAKPLAGLIFGAALTGAELETAAAMVALMAAGIVFLSFALSTGSMLCATGKSGIAVGNALIVLVLKLILVLTMTSNRNLNIMGAAYSTVLSAAVLAAFNGIQLLRRMSVRFFLMENLVAPLIGGACMGAALYFLHFGLLETPMGNAGAIVAIVIGVLVYAAFVVVLKTFNREDYALLPGGERVYETLQKAGLYK